MPAAAWKKPGVVMPFLGVVVAGVLTFGGTVVTVFDDPPPVVDCAEARRDVIEVFDKHPESVVPFNDPVLEERCRINEFLRSLKPPATAVEPETREPQPRPQDTGPTTSRRAE